MDNYILYIILSAIITLLLGILSFYKRKLGGVDPEYDATNDEAIAVRPRPRAIIDTGAGGPRNRAAANRNARARMRVAQAHRQQQHSESEDEENEVEDEIALPDGKIGKKKLAKLQLKAEKRAQREADEKEREEKKEREEMKAEQRKQKEKDREEEEFLREQEERKKQEEEEKRRQEEYEKLKVEFEVEEEGYDEEQDEEKEKDLLNEFINYIKNNKVVVLEDLAAQFKLKTQAVIDRITDLQKDGFLTGVVDDRGKFIYVSRTELESVAKFIRQRGRVSISDLAEASNTLINLNPEISVDC